MPPEQLAIYGLGGAGGLGVLAYLIKHLIETVYSTKTTTTQFSINDSLLERLQSEINRLELIIQKQSVRIDELDSKVNKLRETELRDMSDIAELNAIVESSCLVQLNCPSNNKLQKILTRIKERRGKDE